MAMTPQQFGALVGDQMGKDAGAVAPKSLPVEALKMLGKAVYHTPRSLKALTAGGVGGYAYGHNAGTTAGIMQGRADAAKSLTDLLTKQPEAGVKTAGPISETLGFSSPANILGGAAALMTPTRSLEQQAKFDATDNAGRAIANAFVPGYGAYNMYKRMGSSVRSPEMKAMQAKAMQPQQAPTAAPAPAPASAPVPAPAPQGQPAAAGVKQALLGAAGRAIGGAVSNAVSGAVNAAKPMVNKAVNAMGTPIGQAATTAAVGGGIAAAAIPTLKHLENQRIDAQVDRQRARAMAQQPKPQMATGMPQPAMSMVGKQADITAANNINPALAQQMAAAQPGVPSGPGGGLYEGKPGVLMGPGGGLRRDPPGQGLNPAQQKAMLGGGGVGQQMPQVPKSPLPASTGQGGIMGGGGPLSMSMAGKQAGLVPNAFQATAKGLQQRSDLLQELLGNLQPLSGRKGLKAVGSAFKPERYNGNYGRGLTAQHLNKMTTDAAQQLGNAGDKLDNLQALFPGKQAGAINELLSEFGGKAMKSLQTNARPMLNKAVEGVQTYGKRLTGDSTLKPLQQRADMIHDMTDNFQFPTMRSGARQVGNESYHNLLTSGLDARKAIAKERGAIDLTRNLTTGAGAAGTLGAIGLMARHNNKQANAPAPAASLATSLAPYTSWGRGYNFGTDTTNQHHQNALAGGALMGGVAGLASEAFREKSEEEKRQSILRKFLRYAATSGAGAVGGAGAGGLVGALTAPGKLRMHDSLAAKLPADFTSGKLEAKGLMGLGPVGDGKAAGLRLPLLNTYGRNINPAITSLNPHGRNMNPAITELLSKLTAAPASVAGALGTAGKVTADNALFAAREGVKSLDRPSMLNPHGRPSVLSKLVSE